MSDPPDFDRGDCLQCVLRAIVLDTRKLNQFVWTCNLARLEHWLQLVEASPNDDTFAALLWLITPVVYYVVEGKAKKEIRRWFRQTRVRKCFNRSFSLERTRKFAMTLVNAVESIGAASNQVELREQILKQIDVQTLRKDMSLSNATACCHHSGAGIAPTVSSIRSRTLSSPERSPALSARMEVDESTAPAPGYLRRHTDARGYQMQGSERIYHYQDNTLKIVPLSGKEGLALHWVPGNSRAVLEITCVNHPRMERVASPNLMEIDEL